MKTNVLTREPNAIAFGFTALVLVAASPSWGQIYVPQPAPYTSDANTILLEHFDGTTTGVINGAAYYTSGVYGQGIHLNDSSYVGWSIGALQNGTIEFWAKLDNLQNGIGAPDFAWAYISPSDVGQGPGETLQINVLSADAGPDGHAGMPGAGIVPAPFTGIGSGINSITIAPNEWYNYALTWGDDGLHFYIDGELVGTGPAGGLYGATDYWLIGNANGLGFNGTIDELRISDIQRVFAPSPSFTPTVSDKTSSVVLATVAFGALGMLRRSNQEDGKKFNRSKRR